MHSNLSPLACTAAAIALAASPLPALAQAPGQVVGVNTAVRKVVLISQSAGAKASQARVRERVRLGNAITTRADAGLQVTLLDQTTFTVGPNANLTISKFIYNPDRGTSTAATVARGTFRFLSGGGKRGAERINTPVASIGIRGTLVEGAVGPNAIAMAKLQKLSLGSKVDPAKATFVVLRGPGPDAPPGTRVGEIEVTSGGKTVRLNKPGMAVFVPHFGAVPIPFQMSQVAYQGFDTLLRTFPTSFSPEVGKFVTYAQKLGVKGIVVKWARAGIKPVGNPLGSNAGPGNTIPPWATAAVVTAGGIVGVASASGSNPKPSSP